MKVKSLFNDDDAVSPVIGVILMVAITVILAAVIASFVLGLGDSADEVQPNTSFTFDYDSDNTNVTVTLSDGEALAAEEVFIRGQEIDYPAAPDENESLVGFTLAGGGNITSGDTWSAGQGIIVDVSGGSNPDEYVINVVWESQDTDDSSRLQTDEGPEA
jgi:flagellin-like protein